jgi:hypothetical protein
VFKRELLRQCSDLCREGNFLESNLYGICSGSIQQERTSGNRFFCSGSILETCTCILSPVRIRFSTENLIFVNVQL